MISVSYLCRKICMRVGQVCEEELEGRREREGEEKEGREEGGELGSSPSSISSKIKAGSPTMDRFVERRAEPRRKVSL